VTGFDEPDTGAEVGEDRGYLAGERLVFLIATNPCCTLPAVRVRPG
jgi:hypothetical protein